MPSKREIDILLVAVLSCILPACWGCNEGNGRIANRTEAFGEPPAVNKRLVKAAELFEEGIDARKKGDKTLARQKLKESVALDPANGRAVHALGLIYFETGDLYHSAIQLDRAARILRDRVEPCYNLGLVLERGGKYELAKEAYQRALTRDPDHLETIENLIRLRLKMELLDRETLRLIDRSIERENRADWSEWLRKQRERLAQRLGYDTAETKNIPGRGATKPAEIQN